MLEVITILVTFLFRERVSEALKEGIYESMEKYGKETESNQAIDFLQAQVGGVVGRRCNNPGERLSLMHNWESVINLHK